MRQLSIHNLYYLFWRFSVLSVLIFVCTVVLSFQRYFLTLQYKREVWLAIKPGSTHFFSSQE